MLITVHSTLLDAGLFATVQQIVTINIHVWVKRAMLIMTKSYLIMIHLKSIGGVVASGNASANIINSTFIMNYAVLVGVIGIAIRI